MGASVVSQMYAAMNSDLQSKGNQDGMGPQFLLFNTGDNQFQIISCLIQRLASIPDMPADSDFSQTQFIAVMENKDTAEEDWMYSPITANELFAKRTDRLAAWAAIKIPVQDKSKIQGYPMAKNGVAADFFPVLSLFG
jgi:hypothetical protein